MEIEYVTHASLLIRAGGQSLLLDPFFYLDLDPSLSTGLRNFPARDLSPAHFGMLDFVFSSHEHHDHCHPQTLAVLKDRIGQVLLPAERPILEARYRDVGLDRIRLLQNRETVRLNPDLEVTCIWDDPIDSMLLVKSQGRTLLHANDCLIKLKTLEEIARTHPVDYAFVGYTSAQSLYPFFLPRPEAELERLARQREQQFLEKQLWRLAILEPQVVFPYAFTFAYVLPEQFRLNGYGRLTPPLFAEAVRAQGLPCDCVVLQPGDGIDVQTETIRRLRSENLWGRDLPEFLENLQAYAASIADTLPRFEPGDAAACAEKLQRYLETRVQGGVPFRQFYTLLDDALALEVVGTEGTIGYRIEAGQRRVCNWEDKGSGTGQPSLQITIPASLMTSLLEGVWDAFTVLFQYRVTFQVHPDLRARGLSPTQEYSLCLGAFITLFLGLDDQFLPAMGRELAEAFPQLYARQDASVSQADGSLQESDAEAHRRGGPFSGAIDGN